MIAFPGGRVETVLTVPRYDFNWQLYYEIERTLEARKFWLRVSSARVSGR